MFDAKEVTTDAASGNTVLEGMIGTRELAPASTVTVMSSEVTCIEEEEEEDTSCIVLLLVVFLGRRLLVVEAEFLTFFEGSIGATEAAETIEEISLSV